MTTVAAKYFASRQPPPNVLICGTPGTGKSTLAAQLATQLGYVHIDVSALAVERGCYEGYDEGRQCHILDDDRLLDELEDPAGLNIVAGGCVVDYHGCELFPERFFALVVVLRAATRVLWDRLQARGYVESKIKENVEAEIMQVLLDEARESYAADIVMELENNTPEEQAGNMQAIVARLQAMTT